MDFPFATVPIATMRAPGRMPPLASCTPRSPVSSPWVWNNETEVAGESVPLAEPAEGLLRGPRRSLSVGSAPHARRRFDHAAMRWHQPAERRVVVVGWRVAQGEWLEEAESGVRRRGRRGGESGRGEASSMPLLWPSSWYGTRAGHRPGPR